MTKKFLKFLFGTFLAFGVVVNVWVFYTMGLAKALMVAPVFVSIYFFSRGKIGFTNSEKLRELVKFVGISFLVYLTYNLTLFISFEGVLEKSKIVENTLIFTAMMTFMRTMIVFFEDEPPS